MIYVFNYFQQRNLRWILTFLNFERPIRNFNPPSPTCSLILKKNNETRFPTFLIASLIFFTSLISPLKNFHTNRFQVFSSPWGKNAEKSILILYLQHNRNLYSKLLVFSFSSFGCALIHQSGLSLSYIKV